MLEAEALAKMQNVARTARDMRNESGLSYGTGWFLEGMIVAISIEGGTKQCYDTAIALREEIKALRNKEPA